MTKLPARYKTFNGEKFELYASTKTKTDAEWVKKFIHIRDKTANVRIVKYEHETPERKYGVYTNLIKRKK